MLSEAITVEQIDTSYAGIETVQSNSGPHAELATAVITVAFSTDPIARWVYPQADDYLRDFPAFIRVFAGRSFENGTAYLAPSASGAALWLPPGVGPDDDRMIDLIWSTTTEEIQKDLFPFLEQMGMFHPEEPHWYLPMIGVETHMQGRGIGASLMQHALAVCDEEGLPAYLESSNPRNVPMYERFGFEVIGTIQAGSSPPMYPMYRNAQR